MGLRGHDREGYPLGTGKRLYGVQRKLETKTIGKGCYFKGDDATGEAAEKEVEIKEE